MPGSLAGLRGVALLALLTMGLGSADGAQALPLRITLSPLQEDLTIDGHLTVRSGERSDKTRVEGALPLDVELDVPAGEMAHLSLSAAGVWAAEQVVLPQEPGEQVTVDVYPAGRLTGTVAVESGQARPGELELTLDSPGGETGPGSLSGVRLACEVDAHGRFSCPVPAVPLDARLHARGFIPHYAWDLSPETEEAADLGTVKLRSGASIAGRVVTADGLPPERGGHVILRHATPVETVEPGSRLSRMARRGLLDARGFFQLTDVGAGTYVLQVEKSGFATAEVAPVTVFEGRESSLREPVVLHPPVTFEVVLTPPRDPYGRAWKVDFKPVGSTERQLEPVSDDGSWRREGVAPGPYRLSVWSGSGRYEHRWASEEIEVEAGSPRHELEIPVIEVEGEVRLGEEPLPSLVWFGGRHGPRQVRVDTDEEGYFAGYLPSEGLWKVMVVSDELGSRNLAPVEVEVAEGARAAWVEIVIPDTRVAGEVVDVDGRPVPGAQVLALHTEVDQDMDQAQTDARGEFELRGLSEGTLAISAMEPRTGRSSGASHVDLREELESPRLRLVLEEQQEIVGRLTFHGAPVPGAQVVVGLRAPADQALLSVQPFQTTDVQGRFRTRVPARASGADLLLLAPGYAARLVALALPLEQEVQVEVDQVGGTLRLDWHVEDLAAQGQRGESAHLSADGAVVAAVSLRRWARLHQAPAELGAMVLPMMAPGEYVLCVPQPAGERCASGFLPPGGELVLRVGEPARDERSPAR